MVKILQIRQEIYENKTRFIFIKKNIFDFFERIKRYIFKKLIFFDISKKNNFKMPLTAFNNRV